VEIFEKLRKGEIPETEIAETKDLPDLREMLLSFGRERIKEGRTEDRLLVKFYQMKKELDRIINTYFERIVSFGSYSGVMLEDREPCSLFAELPGITELSDNAIIKEISGAGKTLCALRTDIVTYMRAGIKKVMPNVSDITGEDLALDLLATGKSLENLARMPAGTVQVLGADKAFFSHIRTGSPPPKHGVVFKFPSLTSLPKKARGKYARAASAKIAIAARADLLGTRLNTEKMKLDLESRLSQIRDSGRSQARAARDNAARGSERDRYR
jgi:nucleolar protein 56